jgi:hypothetical protein
MIQHLAPYILMISLASTGCPSPVISDPALSTDLALWITHHQKSATTRTGGVGHSLGFTNPTEHTYQQIAFVFIPYDRFGRRQRSDIDDVDEVQITLPDPVGPGNTVTQSWPDIWFSHQISCVELDRLRIVYADGNTQIFRKADVDTMLATGVNNDCRAR